MDPRTWKSPCSPTSRNLEISFVSRISLGNIEGSHASDGNVIRAPNAISNARCRATASRRDATRRDAPRRAAPGGGSSFSLAREEEALHRFTGTHRIRVTRSLTFIPYKMPPHTYTQVFARARAFRLFHVAGASSEYIPDNISRRDINS